MAGCAEDQFFNGDNSDNIDGDENLNQFPSFGSDSTFSVVTWNIQLFPKNSVYTINLLAKMIVDLNVNIFGLQEITSSSDFNQLMDKVNDLDSLNQWMGFRVEDGNYGTLAYIIDISSVTILNVPYSILGEYDHYFAYREPYVVKVLYMNNEFIIINNHFKAFGDNIIQNDYWDEEYRRQQASLYLKNYVDVTFPNDNVIIIGDLNDKLDDIVDDNVFQYFIQDNANYQFVDIDIATGLYKNYSWPGWGQNTYEAAHFDHILITNELFNKLIYSDSPVQTICLDEYSDTYYQYISDHRPVGLRLVLDP